MESSAKNNPTVRLITPPPTPIAAQPGRDGTTTIEGYEILEKIGTGGQGDVYKARQSSMDRIVAIKVLRPSGTSEQEGIERFVREARAMARLKHPNIVAGIDAGQASGVYYCVMEYLEGESLNKRIARMGKIPWREAMSILKQMAAALDHARQHGLVHRDVKPANILITPDGTAKLLDLGMARIASQESMTLTMSGYVVGTPFYMSPEQARGERDIDIRADLYSLGITFYEMLAGKPPFTALDPLVVLNKHINETVPFEFGDLPWEVSAVGRLLTERDRDSRYATPAELLEDLEAVSAGRRTVHAARPKAARSATRRIAVAAAAAALLLAAGWAWMRSTRGASAGPEGTAPERTVPLAELAAGVKLELLKAIETGRTGVADGTVFHAELEPGFKGPIYSVDVATGKSTYNVIIDAVDGRTLESKNENEDHTEEVRACPIGLVAAVEAALKKEPGQPVDAEMLKGDRPVVSVKVVREGRVVTVHVDGRTGEARTVQEGDPVGGARP